MCVCVGECINVGLLFLGEWITPTVTGERPPPINQFSLTPVTNNTAILFGGDIPNHGGSDIIYVINFTKKSMVSVLISIILLVMFGLSL